MGRGASAADKAEDLVGEEREFGAGRSGGAST
jgi:hypothetical protein